MKQNNLFLILALISPLSVKAAFNDPGTAYTNAKVTSYVWNDALAPIELVNSILCFTAQFNTHQFANAGNYLVLADEAACFDSQESGASAQSSASSNVPKYMKAVTNVTRQNEFSPLVVNVWLPEMGEGIETQAIKFKAEISEGASENNPFGQFRFNYDFFDSFTASNQLGGGEVNTINTIENSIGFTLFETSTEGAHTYQQSASAVMSSDRSNGIALTGTSHTLDGATSYAVAFNDSNVLVQSVNSNFDNLPYKSGDNSGTCLSRTNFDSHVHRYDLFNAATGAKVDINSGFSIKYDGDNNGSYESYGYAGYWGVWTETEGALDNGDTVIGETNGIEKNYQYVSAPGRLIKHSINTINLINARGIQFSYWDNDIFNDNNYDQWVVQYMTNAEDGVAGDGFYKTGKLKWENNGPQITPESPYQQIPIVVNRLLHMYSSQLGGEVKYRGGSNIITYYEQTFINGSETGAGELLNSETITLTCFDRCPKGTLGQSDLTDYSGAGSPFETGPGPINYTFSTLGPYPLTLVRVTNSQPVRYNASLTQSNIASTRHNWGVRSGPMGIGVGSADDLYDPNITNEYYVWETGINDWNQLAALKDDSSNIVSFSRPIQIAYEHSNIKDRSGNADTYNGQKFLINYGGNGDLWGIPNKINSARYQPAFSIADGVLMGNSNQYVIKATDIEYTMKSATGECAGLTLQDPAVPVPSAIQGNADIGQMPIVTEEPAVIGGITQ